ncbi:MAG TPA: hypothetical protein VLG50_01375, partial [Candidatus Saccharimonadales bacterium]|nr:hypothetical protein [Candidatus Saccharimonadales bacterium]
MIIKTKDGGIYRKEIQGKEQTALMLLESHKFILIDRENQHSMIIPANEILYVMLDTRKEEPNGIY